jgi:hypothetical protein
MLLLKLMNAGQEITPHKAMRHSIMALSQRCGELRRAGYPVVSRWIETESLFGKARFKAYRIARETETATEPLG